jgi:hypothetical protein
MWLLNSLPCLHGQLILSMKSSCLRSSALSFFDIFFFLSFSVHSALFFDLQMPAVSFFSLLSTSFLLVFAVIFFHLHYWIMDLGSDLGN